MELYPGVKISIGPPIENGFYYDFDFPEGVSLSRGRLRADRGADARAHRGRRAVRARGRARRARRSSASCAEGQDYKVELIEDLIRDRRRRDGVACTPTDRSPISAAARTRPSTKRIKAFKLQSVAGAYWRGDADQADAHARVWDGVLLERRTSRSTSSGSSGRAPTTTASSARSSGCSRSPTSRPGRRSGCPAGTEVFNSLVALSREMGRRARLHRGQDAAAVRQLAVEDLRPLGQVPRAHVRHRVRGPARWRSSR